MSPWYAAAPLESIPPGGLHAVRIAGQGVLLCRVGAGEIRAVEDCCSHDGAPLADGALDGAVLECGRHGGRFDARTGRALRMPAAIPLATFAARIRHDGMVEVELEAP